MSSQQPKENLSDQMGRLSSRLAQMTVAEIAEETGRSKQVIKGYLTKNLLSAKDYDGMGFATAKVQKWVAKQAEERSLNQNSGEETKPQPTLPEVKSTTPPSKKAINWLAIVGAILLVISIFEYINGSGCEGSRPLDSKKNVFTSQHFEATEAHCGNQEFNAHFSKEAYALCARMKRCKQELFSWDRIPFAKLFFAAVLLLASVM